MSAHPCSRRQFLKTLQAGLGAGAILAILPGCQNDGVQGSVNVAGGVATLSFTDYPELMNPGGAVVVDASGTPIAVARVGAQTSVALSAICTHAGCAVSWESNASGLICPCHGSTFAVNGDVTAGPARAPLRVYPSTVTSSAITVQLG